MSDTATIETLTAEVRTLVVGSRLVTLSVAKQLDEVPLAEVVIFGRVRIRPDEQHVIGRDSDSGSLVLAKYGDPAKLRPPTLWQTDPQTRLCYRDPVVKMDNGYSRANTATLTWGDREVTIDNPRWCCLGRDPDDHVGSTYTAAAIEDTLMAHDQRVALHSAAASSPLIVLAGLK